MDRHHLGTTADLITQANSECALLKLPAELRNRIYEYLVPREEKMLGIRIWARANWSRTDIAFTHVCHAMRADTLPMLYGSTRWTVQVDRHRDPLRARQWLETLDKVAVASIRTLGLYTDTCVCDAAREACKTAESNFEKLNMKTICEFGEWTLEDKHRPGMFLPECKDCGSREEWTTSKNVGKFMVLVDFSDEVNSKLQEGGLEALRKDVVAVIEIVYSLQGRR
jgi:hypothetical protein